MRTLDISAVARGHFAINTRRFLDNMSGIFMNILHGYNDKNILVNIIQVLNDKNITVMSQKLVLTLLKFKDSFPMFEMSLARSITLFARFYTSSYEGKNTEELMKMLVELYPYFEAEGEAAKVARPVTGEVTKLIVTFLQLSPDLKEQVLEFIAERPNLIKFYKRIVLQGPEVDKVT